MLRYVLIFTVVATILNGMGYWSKLVGFTDNQGYQNLILKKQDIYEQSLFYYENPGLRSEQTENELKAEYREYKSLLFDHVYNPFPNQILFKLLKYFAAIIFVLVSIYYCSKSKSRIYLSNTQAIICFLLVVASLTTFYNYGWQPVAAGFNLFLIALIALFSKIENEDLQFLSKCLVGSVGILLLMAPIELSRALQVFNTQSLFKIRMSGFLIQPNTLGIYVVCVYGLYLTFCRDWQKVFCFVLVTLACLILIILSGSMTASIVFLIVVCLYSIEKYTHLNLNNLWILVLLILIASSLYFFEGRDSLPSLLSRLNKFSYYFSTDPSLRDYLMGQGIGIGTNLLLQIQAWIPFSEFTQIPIKINTDSTPLLLMIQVGFVGLLLFYGLLIKAMIHHKELRLMYLTIILCSLTINIIEIFPLNILVGLMLAGGISNLSKAQ